MLHTFKRLPAVLAMMVLTLGLMQCSGDSKYVPRGPRMIVLGFDGVEPSLVQRWMGEGKLPNLQKLMAQGGYRELGSTIPPQSPVAWSTFATGSNPGGHGIYDFINRSPQDYLPGLATLILKQPDLLLGVVPTSKAHGEITRGGVSFWKVAADSGVHATLLTIPYTFPPEEVGEGRMLSGLGTPDLRETNSTFTYLATDLTPEELAESVGGGKLVKVGMINGEIATYLEAMMHPTKNERVRIPVNFSVRQDQSVEIRLDGKSHLITPGTWSPWLPFRVSLTPFLKTTGICRFHLFSASPEFRLYVTPLSIAPSDPYMPISYPESFAKELFERVGYFKTVGWQFDTSALNEERLTDEEFINDMKVTTADRDKIFLSELEQGDWDLFIGVYTDTDRASHMFWRFLDPQHPLYDPVGAAQYGDAIEWTYRHMDEFVGKVMAKYVDKNTTLIVLSDHGFNSYRRNFNVNTWLAQNGYLTFKGMEKLKPGEEIPAEMYPKGEFFPNVVWRKSKAYSLGTGQIYLNLMGREGQGAVRPGQEYYQLLDEIKTKLLAERDPATGEAVVQAVYLGKEVYRGNYLDQAPDLQLGYTDGYRTSKETMLGGIPPELLTNNLGKWSGDHSASPMEECSGVLFSNRKITKEQPAIVDFAATVLDYFGVQKLPEMEGSSFLAGAGQDSSVIAVSK
ncbi:MAG: hypothetical protein C4524_03120 [Candidatus Zixiibacteriota bacterium]|nr:MAG: hypothetical protein C4524_03120 [candidate division Zixibacteria bacterium]